MRNLLIASAMGIVALTAVPAAAQDRPRETNREYNRDVREAQRERARNLRRADDRGDVREARREYREDVRDARKDRRQGIRDWRQSRRYDWNRLEPGQRRYYADRYYRSGNYRPIRVTRQTRIYRGQDNRYYCRRSDGTTGLIVGAIGGGVLGNLIGSGDSKLITTIIGGGAGALLGREIDRGNVSCR
jgi:uncharacterized protein YcfJ